MIRCDVCGELILGILDETERIHTFSVTSISRKLHCDNACKQALIDAGTDWTKLPDGPLRRTFEKHHADLAD